MESRYENCSLLCITYTLQFLDKLSLNYAAAYTLKEDLNLYGQRYSWCAAIFNFGYLAGALPANYVIQNYPLLNSLDVCCSYGRLF